MSDTHQDETMTISIGETVAEHRRTGGPVAAVAESFDPGTATVSVRVQASTLRQAIGSDLGDSYTDVYLFTDGETLAVTDHREPLADETEPALTDFDETVVRTDVIDPADASVRTLVDRGHAETVLTEFDGAVTVYVDPDGPVAVQGTFQTIVIAPRGHQEKPGRRGAKA